MGQTLMDGGPQRAQRGGLAAFVQSFGYAFQGVAYAFRTQRNMKVHAAFAVAAVALGFALRISAAGWAAVVICMVLVFSAECMNTAMEALVDGVSPGYSEFARRAKDCAAGCVLVCALGAVAVACVVYGGALLGLLR